MAPARSSKKRRPSFRRLLKTSGSKLENKLKNRQFKRESCDKRQRKEHKRLRQALKGAALATPRPLDAMPKRPEEEEDEEDFLESLPTDMMEDDDLRLTPSFLGRDLSSCGPVHAAKKRKSEVVRAYEEFPRKMAAAPLEEVVHLLPIKDKTRLIPQSIRRAVTERPEDEEEEEEMQEEGKDDTQVAESALSAAPLSAAQQWEVRARKISERKLTIARLASTVIADPVNNIKGVKQLRGMLMEADPCVAVTVRKLAMVSLMEIFKDIAPTYKIRPLTDTEKGAKVKRETQQLREFEEGLLSQYKFYLEDLEQCIKDWKQKKSKRSRAVPISSYPGLAGVAVRCLCELLQAMSHFNFHNNILVALAPLMNDRTLTVSTACCDAFATLFRQDKAGEASLAAVRVVSGLVKSLNYDVRPEVLRTLLSVRIQEAHVKKDLSDTAPALKLMTHKDKGKLSRMKRKWKKAEEKLQQELLEAEASDSKDKKMKTHTETLNIVFLIYFRILKKAHKSVLLPAVLEGLANFAHLINLEFFDDLLDVLQGLVCSGDLSNRERLHCVQTVFTILSGQGDVLTVDPLNFYSHLYGALLWLHAGAPHDDVTIALRCLDAALIGRRKRVGVRRAAAFLKRLASLALRLDGAGAVGVLAAAVSVLRSYPKCDFLLDNELQGSGSYLPEAEQPEHCNAHNTALWELHALRRHFHPTVSRLASHLSRGAPAEGSAALPPELSRRSATELYEDYRVRDVTFEPAATPHKRKKREFFSQDWSLLDDDLRRRVDNVLNDDGEAELEFTQAGISVRA
ncbi:nucleolar complex protein 3 homolog isoform X2 [Stigmatopora argus]